MKDEGKPIRGRNFPIPNLEKYEREALAMNPIGPTALILFLSVLLLQTAGLDLEDAELLTYIIGFCLGTAFGWWFPI